MTDNNQFIIITVLIRFFAFVVTTAERIITDFRSILMSNIIAKYVFRFL